MAKVPSFKVIRQNPLAQKFFKCPDLRKFDRRNLPIRIREYFGLKLSKPQNQASRLIVSSITD